MAGGYYGDDQRDLVKARTDIAVLVGEYSVLRRSGPDLVCCCVFHQERTPSMHVYVDERRYHCFGCGAHGDAIDLVMERERCDFREALEFLARRAGVVLVPQGGGAAKGPTKAKREQLLAVVAFAQRFYEQQLWSPAGAAGLAYLRGRGFTDETIRAFGCGWAPGRAQLVSQARAAGDIALEHLVATGLAKDRDHGLGDVFFDRVTFPICNRFGDPIAFTGRILPEAEAKARAGGGDVRKYVNSTETPLFHKGATIWNLHRAKEAARTSKRLLVMEGPTDVMAAHQLGLSDCCACLGTAFTGEHATLLNQAVGPDGTVLLVLDGDDAGQKGAAKAVRTALAAGVLVSVVVLPDQLDIAELLVEACA